MGRGRWAPAPHIYGVVMQSSHPSVFSSGGDLKVLHAWIEQGAEYRPHWAYIVPQRPALPTTVSAKDGMHPIDRFIRAELDELGPRDVSAVRALLDGRRMPGARHADRSRS